jgi:hypothetical protein
MRHASHHGEVMNCGDSITRRNYIDILVLSLDGKAAWCYCGTRAYPANFPCPRCMVHREQLDDLLDDSLPRTTDWMRRVYEEAQTKHTKGEKDQLLRDHGLHSVEVGSLAYPTCI